MEPHLRVNYGPDPNPTKPRLKLPEGAWDTHFHINGPPHVFPYAEPRSYTPAATPIEHYLKLAEFLGFERGVVVHPNPHGNDNAVTLNAIAKSDGRLLGMVRADSIESAADVKRLHAAGIRGVRLSVAQTIGDHFDQALFDRTVALCADAGWVVALHIDPKGLIDLGDLVRRMPVQTVIDNYAMIDAREGPDQPAVNALCDLAQEPHVWLKTASAYRMLFKGATREQMLPVAQKISQASPERVIWGTDWPHPGVFELGRMPNDGEIVDWLLDFVPDEENRRKMLVDNPKRLFDSA